MAHGPRHLFIYQIFHSVQCSPPLRGLNMNTGVKLVVQAEQPQISRNPGLFSLHEPAEQRCEQACSEG